jgi:transcriptional antiterminator RfaH
MLNWYLVTTKTGEQDKAEDSLGSQMFEVFNPKLNAETIEPLFPGYVFVRFDPDVQAAAKINYSRGVRKLVTFGDVAVPIPVQVVDFIKGARPVAPKPAQPVPRETRNLKQGEKVKVIEGPFAGIEAVFDEPNGQQRSFLIIEMLGKQQRVAVANSLFA